VTGTRRLGNSTNGVYIDGASNNTIGGTSPLTVLGTTSAACNIISANGGSGVAIESPAGSGNLVEGNYIGTDVTSTKPGLGNLLDGVSFYSASKNTIGGTTTGSGNLISANGRWGVLIEPDPSVPNSTGADNNLVQNNDIGTDETGRVELGNIKDGIEIFDSNDNLIGGKTPSASNLISGNFGFGVSILNLATGNEVEGNLIGTKASGLGTDISNGTLPNGIKTAITLSGITP